MCAELQCNVLVVMLLRDWRRRANQRHAKAQQRARNRLECAWWMYASDHEHEVRPCLQLSCKVQVASGQVK